jgi:hypothetical protein
MRRASRVDVVREMIGQVNLIYQRVAALPFDERVPEFFARLPDEALDRLSEGLDDDPEAGNWGKFAIWAAAVIYSLSLPDPPRSMPVIDDDDETITRAINGLQMGVTLSYLLRHGFLGDLVLPADLMERGATAWVYAAECRHWDFLEFLAQKYGREQVKRWIETDFPDWLFDEESNEEGSGDPGTS